jgi:hypothetical protein
MIAKSFGIEKCCFHEVVGKHGAEVREITAWDIALSAPAKPY